MEVPTGLIAKLWSFITFLPFFILLSILGLLKAAMFGPLAVAIILLGNSVLILGLWPAHFVWTVYCVAKTKRLGPSLKILSLLSLPLLLLLWPVLGILGSLLGGMGYGFFNPLLATFEAVGEDVTDKFLHCFLDGGWSTVQTSCTVVRDFTDFSFHSFFSFMDELRDQPPVDQKPLDVKLSKVPICFLVVLLGVPVDFILITAVALVKGPYMLYKGWKRLLEDLIGREGPFLETVCVPFAGLAIILWPLAVIATVIGSVISSFFLGFYSGVIVYQEDSLRMGFAYIISVVSLFDEYTNDLLYLREGSCLPRPKYRRNMSTSPDGLDSENSIENDKLSQQGSKGGPANSTLISEGSRKLKWSIQQYKPVQMWDWLFRSCEQNGRVLLREGLIEMKDIEECILKGKGKKLSIKLPAWSILQCLISSAKSGSSGLVISPNIELTRSNCSKDKVFEWFIGPLLIMKEQLKGLQLRDDEECCLKRLIMVYKNEIPENWDDSGFPSKDNVRRAQLQALIRRLQGIVASMSRIPTFRRRFRSLVKMLYIEAVGGGAMPNLAGGSLKTKCDMSSADSMNTVGSNTNAIGKKARDSSSVGDVIV